jgi:hypothetical protein
MQATPVVFTSTNLIQLQKQLKDVAKPHFHQSRGVQMPERPYTVLQLSEVWPCLGQLQTTFPLLVVWGLPPAQGLPRKGEHSFNANMLQLPVG